MPCPCVCTGESVRIETKDRSRHETTSRLRILIDTEACAVFICVWTRQVFRESELQAARPGGQVVSALCSLPLVGMCWGSHLSSMFSNIFYAVAHFLCYKNPGHAIKHLNITKQYTHVKLWNLSLFWQTWRTQVCVKLMTSTRWAHGQLSGKAKMVLFSI